MPRAGGVAAALRGPKRWEALAHARLPGGHGEAVHLEIRGLGPAGQACPPGSAVQGAPGAGEVWAGTTCPSTSRGHRAPRVNPGELAGGGGGSCHPQNPRPEKQTLSFS